MVHDNNEKQKNNAQYEIMRSRSEIKKMKKASMHIYIAVQLRWT